MVSQARAQKLVESVTRPAVLRLSRQESVTQEELMHTIRVSIEAMQTLVTHGIEAPQ